MKKLSKPLSMILALALAFALAVPAFAAQPKTITNTERGITVTMNGYLRTELVNFYPGEEDSTPITLHVVADGSTVEIKAMDGFQYALTDEDWETFETYMYDHDFSAEGSGFAWGYSAFCKYDIADNSFGFGGDAPFPLDGPETYTAGPSDTYIFINSTYGASWICESDFAKIAAEYKLGPTQPEQPSTPANKPAPGVSVALNDGSGEFAYTIKYGDTLSGLAAYYYGDMNVYKLIYERNKTVLKSANMIYAGQVITLPSYAAVAEFRASAQKPASPAPEQPAPEGPSGESVTYTVKAGDNLSKIAKAFYGDAAKWGVIYEANRATISNPNSLRVGQVLTIPAR